MAPSEPRKRLYPAPRVTNFALESATSRFACPRFGSKIKGIPAKSERAPELLIRCPSAARPARPLADCQALRAGSIAWLRSEPGVRDIGSAIRVDARAAVRAAFAAVWREREPHPRTAHPAASSTSPAARTRTRTTDVPNQRRSTFTRSSDAVKPVFFRSILSLARSCEELLPAPVHCRRESLRPLRHADSCQPRSGPIVLNSDQPCSRSLTCSDQWEIRYSAQVNPTSRR